ncbi:MAG: hypothetical protein RRB22_03495 [Gammaproteobacteria bacterium]|nr:hypothetical protein [Gammaproteobacteria bacterium]
MRFFIKEWANKTATLMAENGTVLWTFSSVEDAEVVARQWQSVQGVNMIYRLDSITSSDIYRDVA